MPLSQVAPRPRHGAVKRFLALSFLSVSALGVVTASAAADCQPAHCPKPDATTGAATSITPTSAVLNGSVTTHNGSVGTYRFELGTSDADMTTVGSGPVDEKEAPTAVSVNATGLKPGTNYQFRVVITSSWGTVKGDLQTFGTPVNTPPPPAAAPPAAPPPPPARTLSQVQLTAGTPSLQDDAAPFQYRIRGRISPVANTAGFCHGSVTVRVKRGRNTLSTTTPQLTDESGLCRYDSSVTLGAGALARSNRLHSLRVLVSFAGNDRLASATAPVFRLFYRG